MDTVLSTAETQLQEKKGEFAESLLRSNKKIRADRALNIIEEAQMKYRRKKEDLAYDLRQAILKRNGRLDLSPTTADSLVLASDFDADGFVNQDLQESVNIENLEIKLRIAKNRYIALFGEEKEA